MSVTARWILTAVCAALGVVDILVFLKTPKTKRTKLHFVLLACAVAVLALAALNAIKLVST